VLTGPTGAAFTGPTGIAFTGPTGSGAVLTGPTGAGPVGFAEFYATMPTDNPVPITGGSAISFPRLGPTDGSVIGLTGSTSAFTLVAAGTYLVNFQASVSAPAQLAISLNLAQQSRTAVGATGPTGPIQLSGSSIIQTVSANTNLRIINSNGIVPFTVAPNAGSPNLVIMRLR
jgi:hypothetical protein